jgi:hypothetical protein
MDDVPWWMPYEAHCYGCGVAPAGSNNSIIVQYSRSTGRNDLGAVKPQRQRRRSAQGAAQQQQGRSPEKRSSSGATNLNGGSKRGAPGVADVGQVGMTGKWKKGRSWTSCEHGEAVYRVPARHALRGTLRYLETSTLGGGVQGADKGQSPSTPGMHTGQGLGAGALTGGSDDLLKCCMKLVRRRLDVGRSSSEDEASATQWQSPTDKTTQNPQYSRK